MWVVTALHFWCGVWRGKHNGFILLQGNNFQKNIYDNNIFSSQDKEFYHLLWDEMQDITGIVCQSISGLTETNRHTCCFDFTCVAAQCSELNSIRLTAPSGLIKSVQMLVIIGLLVSISVKVVRKDKPMISYLKRSMTKYSNCTAFTCLTNCFYFCTLRSQRTLATYSDQQVTSIC